MLYSNYSIFASKAENKISKMSKTNRCPYNVKPWSLNLHREAFHLNTTKPSGPHQAQYCVFLADRLLEFLVDHHLEYFVDHRLEYFIDHHLEYFWSRIFLLNRHLEYLTDLRFSFHSRHLCSSFPCFPFVLFPHLERRRISIFTRFNDFDFTTFVFST